MKHYIIAKYKADIENKESLLSRIREIFSAAGQIPGVHTADVFSNCIDRDNRFDVMVVLDMESDALPEYDNSEMHRQWKSEFGSLLEKKAIFDCE